LKLETTKPAETEAAGAELAAGLAPGDVVLVTGELGSGKTTFVRGAVRALGVDGPVTSPTFTIGHVLPGRPEVAHVDLYRLGSLAGEDPARRRGRGSTGWPRGYGWSISAAIAGG
jgi:tRNA threonylcarbamoyladenosine biosynthesis protein TsaE